MRWCNSLPKLAGMASTSKPNPKLKRPISSNTGGGGGGGGIAPLSAKRSSSVKPRSGGAGAAATPSLQAPLPPQTQSAEQEPPRAPPARLLDRVRHAVRLRHYSIRTEQAYVDWVRRFILFHGKRHPDKLGAAEVQSFLTHLAVDRSVASPTQNQAKSALLFLYREVLSVRLPWLDDVVGAKLARRLPLVLTPSEVRSLLGHLSGTMALVGSLLYGTGMRLLEALRLRVKDVEFERRELIIRDGKGAKDRVTVLPENLMLPLHGHLARVQQLHLRVA